MEGADIRQIAKNSRTSVIEMIEEYDAAHQDESRRRRDQHHETEAKKETKSATDAKATATSDP